MSTITFDEEMVTSDDKNKSYLKINSETCIRRSIKSK